MLTTVLLLVAMSSTRADADSLSWMAGPVLGFRLGAAPGPRGVFGVEGGAGWGPHRLNLGFEHRDHKQLGYLEFDPWFLLGASMGFGVDSDGEPQIVLGIWEGLPIGLERALACTDQYSAQATISAGYRYTGVHELYVTVKAGAAQPACVNIR